jgi:hypothetical protein
MTTDPDMVSTPPISIRSSAAVAAGRPFTTSGDHESTNSRSRGRGHCGNARVARLKDAPRNATEIILRIPAKGWPG